MTYIFIVEGLSKIKGQQRLLLDIPWKYILKLLYTTQLQLEEHLDSKEVSYLHRRPFPYYVKTVKMIRLILECITVLKSLV